MATISIPNVSEPLRTLSDWLSEPETRLWMEEAASDTTAAIKQSIAEDRTLRPPREASDKVDGFRIWLNRYDEATLDQMLRGHRFQMTLQFVQEFDRRFASTFKPTHNRSVVGDAFVKMIWPELESQFRDHAHNLLLAYAVRSIVLSFLGRKVGDCLLVDLPQRQSSGNWSVSFSSSSTGRHIADVSVDSNGEVQTDAESLRQRVDIALA